MIKSFVIGLCLLVAAMNECHAQNELPGLTSLSLEIGKTGLIYNLNIDRKLSNNNIGFRINAGTNFGQYLNLINACVGGYKLFGKRRFFETGIDIQYLMVDEISDDQKGFTFVYPDYSIKTLYTSLNLGYRSYGKKTMFRIGLAPGMIKNECIFGGYISYGLVLNRK